MTEIAYAVRNTRSTSIATSTVRFRISSCSSPAARNGTFNTAPNTQYTSNESRLQPFNAPIATASDATAYISSAIAQSSW